MKARYAYLLTLFLAAPFWAPRTAIGGVSTFSDACDGSEKWTFSRSIDTIWQTHFNNFLASRSSIARGFSEAIDLRRRETATKESMAFGEYWVARALFKAELYHIAYNGFTAIAMKQPDPTTQPVQVAALECLLKIRELFPNLTLHPEIIRVLPDLKGTTIKSVRNTLDKAAFQIFLTELGHDPIEPARVKVALSSMSKGSPEHRLSLGLAAAANGKDDEVIPALNSFLALKTRPEYLERFVDRARQVLARSYYSMEQHDGAIRELKLIHKNSNILSDALTELGWAYLQNDMLREAIGTAINLQTGGLRRTYSPEASMIMAMALNELCQYPASVRAIGSFRRHYRDPYFWLASWREKFANKRADFYSLTLEFLKLSEKQARSYKKVPFSIAAEWMRSPYFIARQDEINLLFDERDRAQKLAGIAEKEQGEMAHVLLSMVRNLKEAFKRAQIQLRPGESMPKPLLDEVEKLRTEFANYRRFRQAAPVWNRVLGTHLVQSGELEKYLVRTINTDLHRLTRQMLDKVETVAETTELIEVEIYSGASQDIIWQNAHPDYQKIASGFKNQDQKAVDSSKVYKWGYTNDGLDGSGEIWEDELGSFKADLHDNCNNKEKYLAIQVNKKGAN